MPYDTKISKTGAYWRFFGAVPFEEILTANNEVWGRDDWETMQYQIADFLAVDAVTVDASYAQAIGHMDDTATKDMAAMKIALIADKPEIIELCEAYAGPLAGTVVEARIFSNLEDAIAWAKS